MGKIDLQLVLVIGSLIGGIIKAYFMHSPKGSGLDKTLVWVVAALQEEHLRAIYDLATDPVARREEAILLVVKLTSKLPIQVNNELAGKLVDYIVREWPHIEQLFGKVVAR